MTEFAHEYASHDEAATEFRIREGAASTLTLHRADGTVHAVDSDEMPAIADLDTAISKAMFAVGDYDDHCDLYRFGGYWGTAEYVDLTPDSWFSRMEVVFSEPC